MGGTAGPGPLPEGMPLSRTTPTLSKCVLLVGREGSDLPTPTESLAGRSPWARCTSAGLGVLRKHGGAERKPRECWRHSLRGHTVPLGILFPQGGDSLSSLGSFAAVHVGNVGEPALNSHIQDHPRHGAWEPRGACISTSATCPPCSSGKDVLPPRRPQSVPQKVLRAVRWAPEAGQRRRRPAPAYSCSPPVTSSSSGSLLCPEPEAPEPRRGGRVRTGTCTHTETYVCITISHASLPSIP